MAISPDRLPSPSRRATTSVRHRELHGRLIGAAEAAVAETGLQNLRARQLAEIAGCSVGAIYGVFPDLDALILAVNARTLAAIDTALREAAPAKQPAARLVRLAQAYLNYAAANRLRWDALFQHRIPDGQTLPGWYIEQQNAAFSHIEQPLAVLLPSMPDGERILLARTLFSAVHGVVALGLTEKVATTPMPVLRTQLQVLVEAVCHGLASASPRGSAQDH